MCLRTYPDSHRAIQPARFAKPRVHQLIAEAPTAKSGCDQHPPDCRRIARHDAQITRQFAVDAKTQMPGHKIVGIGFLIGTGLFDHEHRFTQRHDLMQRRGRHIAQPLAAETDFAHGLNSV